MHWKNFWSWLFGKRKEHIKGEGRGARSAPHDVFVCADNAAQTDFKRITFFAHSTVLEQDNNSQKNEENEEFTEETGDDPFAYPIGDSIDLHTFAPKDVRSVVDEYLREAYQKDFREVRIIHGKGKGVQRRIVQSLLSNHEVVESFRDAQSHEGGWGATIAMLKKRET